VTEHIIIVKYITQQECFSVEYFMQLSLLTSSLDTISETL